MDNLEQIAQQNMETRFVDNPCRGIVLGMNAEGMLVQLAWTMGRSEGSQNRVYTVIENKILRTEAADPKKVLGDPNLLLYNTMNNYKEAHLIGNGNQTDTIYNQFEKEGISPESFVKALSSRHCEPDASTFTPRISGYQQVGEDKAYISILKADPIARGWWFFTIDRNKLKPSDFKSNKEFVAEAAKLSGLNPEEFPTIRNFYELNLKPRSGYCITTYKQKTSKTLDSFEGEPFLVPIMGSSPYSLFETMEIFWEKLEPQWRVSLGGKIINEHVKYDNLFDNFDKRTIFSGGERGNYHSIAEPINRFKKVE